MQLNDIRLSEELLRSMYTSTLVVTETEARPGRAQSSPEAAGEGSGMDTKPAGIPESPEKKEPVQYLGKNLKKFVITVNYAGHLHLPEDAFEFLGNILKACQLNAADVAIINLAKQSPSMEDLVLEMKPEWMVCFGEDARPAGLPVAGQFQAVRLGGLQFMQAPSLELLKQQTDQVRPLKKQLWEGLKQMLQIQ